MMTPEAHMWLGRAITVESTRLRLRYELTPAEFSGQLISDDMLSATLADMSVATLPPLPDSGLLGSRFRTLGLDLVQDAVLALAIAPEYAPRYATAYAYLHDEVGRAFLSLDLCLRLLDASSDDVRHEAILRSWGPGGILAKRGLITPLDEPGRPISTCGWRASPPIIHRALDLPGQFSPMLTLSKSTKYSKHIDMEAIDALSVSAPYPPLLLAGPPGSGRTELAESVAAKLHRPILHYDPEIECGQKRATFQNALVAAELQDALLLVSAGAELQRPKKWHGHVPVAFIVSDAAAWRDQFGSELPIEISVVAGDTALRRNLWTKSLRGFEISAPRGEIAVAAERFTLSALRINNTAAHLAAQHGEGLLPGGVLLDAARRTAAADLGPLAQRARLHADWQSLVLPDGALAQLKDFTNAIRTRTHVLGDWGFENIGRGAGRGLVAMFSGASGTGKTMSAEVVAKELSLDLWCINLAGLVSKYIGETEKNLERLFSAPGAENAILFFDEADAIFGKRSEVRDSHDRYANIESAYLLQRLERFDGIVVLATNLARNIDTAFLRRIPFVIDFPMPDVAARQALWEKALPAAAPTAPDVKPLELGERYEMAGGDIRSAALDAGFRAASGKGVIDAELLETAIERQMAKRGQIPPRRKDVPGNRMNGHAA